MAKFVLTKILKDSAVRHECGEFENAAEMQQRIARETENDRDGEIYAFEVHESIGLIFTEKAIKLSTNGPRIGQLIGDAYVLPTVCNSPAG